MMSEADIRKEHREALDKELQVKILADLNCTTARVIKRILSGETWEQAKIRKFPKSYGVNQEKNKHWTIFDIEFIRDKREQGYKVREIADMMDIDVTHVRSAMYRFREFFPINNEHLKIPTHESKLIISLHKEGLPIKYICEATKRKENVIRNHLRIKGFGNAFI